MHPLILLKLMILLAVANGTPVVAAKILGRRFAYPLDGGAAFFDGRPLLGASKTIRGVLLAILATALAGPLLGLGWRIGCLVGSLAMAGDLFSSFLKRRLGRPPSGQAVGLDQVPESLLPLLACVPALSLTAADVAVGVVAFFIAEVLLSRLFFRLGLRDRPY
jgi:hypothetical protein